MQYWKEVHEGHTERCCLCIPINVGVHIIGILQLIAVLGGCYSLYSAIVLGFWVTIVQAVIGLMLVAYPSFFFVKMLIGNNEDTRKHYAAAFKLTTQIMNALYIIAAILDVIYTIYLMIALGTFILDVLIALLVVLGIIAIAIFLLLHYNRVINSYAHPINTAGMERLY